MTAGPYPYSYPISSPHPEPGVTQILFVCRANQCRSPYAEAIARRLAGDRPLRFASGGLLSGGRPMPEAGRRVAGEVGLDFSKHVSREVDLHDFGQFDVILTMAREQARELVAADPDARPRIFTLKQFARWIGANPRPDDSAVGPWLDAVAADRPAADLLGDDGADVVADPLRLPPDAWRRMIRELAANLKIVVDGLAPSRDDG